MERQRQFEPDRPRDPQDDPPGGDCLDQHRQEIDGLLRATDHVFDSIDSVQAHRYLEQNVQSGGQ